MNDECIPIDMGVESELEPWFSLDSADGNSIGDRPLLEVRAGGFPP